MPQLTNPLLVLNALLDWLQPQAQLYYTSQAVTCRGWYACSSAAVRCMLQLVLLRLPNCLLLRWLQVLGRTSVDIIKSGGYKLSALDIESTLLHHHGVAEAAVLGVPDEALGQILTALVYPKPEEASGDTEAWKQQLLGELEQLCRQELAGYSVPRKWVVLDAPLPRNAMGKVNKKELLAKLYDDCGYRLVTAM